MRPESNGFKLPDVTELERAREKAIQAWVSAAIPRELPRIGAAPNQEGEREWRESRGIYDGDWLTAMRPQFETWMRPDSGSLADRIFACGILQTAGFKGELAVRLDNNRLVPVTSNYIRNRINQAVDDWLAAGGFDLEKLRKEHKEQLDKLHATKQDVRRGLARLEVLGRALRTNRNGVPLRNLPPDEKKGLQEGEILLFFFFRPLPPEPAAVGTGCLPIFAESSPFLNISHINKVLSLKLDPAAVVTNAYLHSEVVAAHDDYRTDVAAALKVAKGKVAVAKEKAQKRVSVAAERQHKERNSVRNEKHACTVGNEGTPDDDACLHADPPEQESKNPRLAGLRQYVPDEFLSSESLIALDQYLKTTLGADYSPPAYIAFVAQRRRSGKIHAGLIFDRKGGLPRDFINKVREEAGERRATEEAKRSDEIRVAHEILDDPRSSDDLKELARETLRKFAARAAT
jgi:hypothetical protein